MKIFIVDGDSDSRDILKNYFGKDGHDVSCVSNGRDAIGTFTSFRPDIVLLEISLPYKDGMQVCREIRSHSSVPIILITAKNDVFNKVLGFEIGADDYIVKPFDPAEVAARVRAVIRGFKNGERLKGSDTIRLRDVEIDIHNYDLKIRGKSVKVTQKELELLYHLAMNPGRAFSREQLLDRVWGYDFLGGSRTIDVHIKRIREKLKCVSDQCTIKSVWGVGYKFISVE